MISSNSSIIMRKTRVNDYADPKVLVPGDLFSIPQITPGIGCLLNKEITFMCLDDPEQKWKIGGIFTWVLLEHKCRVIKLDSYHDTTT